MSCCRRAVWATWVEERLLVCDSLSEWVTSWVRCIFPAPLIREQSISDIVFHFRSFVRSCVQVTTLYSEDEMPRTNWVLLTDICCACYWAYQNTHTFPLTLFLLDYDTATTYGHLQAQHLATRRRGPYLHLQFLRNYYSLRCLSTVNLLRELTTVYKWTVYVNPCSNLLLRLLRCQHLLFQPRCYRQTPNRRIGLCLKDSLPITL